PNLRVAIPRRHPVLVHDFPDRLTPGHGVVVAQERHRADLAGPVTLLAVVLNDARDLFRVGDLAGFLRLDGPCDEAARRLGGRRRHGFTGEHLAHGLCQIAARRLDAGEADTILVVDTAVISHLSVGVDNEDLRRALGPELV